MWFISLIPGLKPALTLRLKHSITFNKLGAMELALISKNITEMQTQRWILYFYFHYVVIL